jgi:hypothetical protein
MSQIFSGGVSFELVTHYSDKLLAERRVQFRGEAENLLFAITSRPALLVTHPPTQRVPETPSVRVKRSEHKGGRLTSILRRN